MNDTKRYLKETYSKKTAHCDCWGGKTLHTDRPRDSDDGKLRCQWCGSVADDSHLP